MPMQPNSNAYAWSWLLTEPLLWLCYVLVVLELYSLVLNRFTGIATMGRWVLSAAFGISVVLSLLSMLPELNNSNQTYPLLTYINVIRRGLSSSLVIFLVLITVFLRWYPVPLSRNLIVHTIIFSVYFLSYAVGLFARNIVGPEITRPVSTVFQSVGLLCIVGWLALLSRKGEARALTLRRDLRREDEQRILEHLDAINSTLLRSGRK